MTQSMSEVSWKVGGQQGEGIESSGEIMATALNRLGYYLYGYRHFSSRIKGGHTNYNITISLTPIGTIASHLNILIAFDQETIDINGHELQAQGIIIADAQFQPAMQNVPEKYNLPVYSNAPHTHPDILIIGMGASRGAIAEAIVKLTADHVTVNHAHIRLLYPFPVEQLQPLYSSARCVVVVEHNATGQLAQLIRMNITDAGQMTSLLKYDGGIFHAASIYEKCKEVL